MPKLKMSDFDRVMKFVNKTPEGHWLWTGSRCGLNQEYGQVKYGGKTRVAHRVVWILHNGGIPKGMDLLHQCGQTLCVNPAHLRVGTALQNTGEAIAARGGKFWLKGRKDMIGDNHPRCRIPDSEVPTVIQAVAEGVSRKHLAAKYKVSLSTIDFIASGKRKTLTGG